MLGDRRALHIHNARSLCNARQKSTVDKMVTDVIRRDAITLDAAVFCIETKICIK
jgi:hypothetical protein